VCVGPKFNPPHTPCMVRDRTQVLSFVETIQQLMVRPNGRISGILFLVASAQFILGLVVSESLYPGYSVSDNYVSDLGIGPSSMIFNSSAFLLGTLILVGTYFLRHISKFKVVSKLLLFMAIGAMGIGIFTENFRVAHGAAALVAFIFSGLSAIASFRVLEKPLSLISVILGVVSLGSLVLYLSGFITSGSLTSNEALDSNFFLGIGPGGMERMIVYPALIWLILFSGNLISLSNAYTKKESEICILSQP